MPRCVAVVNDQTGNLVYVLDSCVLKFPVINYPITRMKKVTFEESYGYRWEYEILKVERYDGLTHVLNTENYSLIYEGQE